MKTCRVRPRRLRWWFRSSRCLSPLAAPAMPCSGLTQRTPVAHLTRLHHDHAVAVGHRSLAAAASGPARDRASLRSLAIRRT